MARNERGEGSRNQKMKGPVSHARVFGVYPVSSQEPWRVYMLEKEGTPLTCSVTNGFNKAKDWKQK